MLSRPTLASVLFTLLALPGAALEWKAQTLTFTTAPFQVTQEAAFEFKNTGAKPVTIIEVGSSCDCLEAEADRTVYAPGASGTIKARFTIGDRLGLYERSIKIVTDEPGEPVRLLVKIEVPEIVTLSPRSVAWTIHEPAEEKIVDVRSVPGVAIEFTDAQPTTGTFVARLETIEPGRHYRLHLKPPGTAEPANAAIRLFGHDTKTGRNVVVSAYGNVR